MNKEELIKQFDEKLQQLRDEFISNLEDDKKEFELTYPEEDETVYYIDSDEGEICDTPYFANSSIDNYMYEHGLYFNLKDEAKHFLRERKLLFKLHQWAKLKNEGWEPDWSDYDEFKYYIKSYVEDKELWINSSCRCNSFTKLPYFKSREIAQECIDLFGNEIIEVLC